MNQRYLYMSNIAQLVGVSIKTVRHYHKMGLLPEPERTESGYRLYNVAHVKRLHLIRQMRAIGLSLAQIRTVIQAPDYELRLRETLQDVLDEIDEQIHELSERRDRIFALLANAQVNYEDLDASPSVYLEKAQDKLGHIHLDVDEALVKQEAQIDAVLSAFQWSEELPGQFQTIIHYFQANPQQYQAYAQDMQSIWQQLDTDIDETDMTQIAHDFVNRHYEVFEKLQSLSREANLPENMKHIMNDLMSDVISSPQKRFTQALFQAYHRINEHQGET